MNSNVTFRWIISGMFAVIMAMTGWIISNINSAVASTETRLYAVELRLAKVEAQLERGIR